MMNPMCCMIFRKNFLDDSDFDKNCKENSNICIKNLHFLKKYYNVHVESLSLRGISQKVGVR